VNEALVYGKRGLPGGKSLAVLLSQQRKVRTRVDLRPLTNELILKWARAYRRNYGRWPNRNSGAVENSGGETWSGIGVAVSHGLRGLHRGTTLHQLVVADGAQNRRKKMI
jgi:hypothetical protein